MEHYTYIETHVVGYVLLILCPEKMDFMAPVCLLGNKPRVIIKPRFNC
jgi:hypothetical protein